MRNCALCLKPNPDQRYPEEIRVCRACELARHTADQDGLTPERFIAGSGWRLAKTMLDAPHQYTVRDLASPDGKKTTAMGHAEFEWFAKLTLDEGVPAQWGNHTYRYLPIEGWEYWTMGLDLEVTTIINRRPISPETTAALAEQVAEARLSR